MRLLILAVSSHNGGRCVAGKAAGDGRWLRLVTQIGPVPACQMQLQSGGAAKVGDVLEVSLQDDKPRTGAKTPHQIENRLLADSRWRKIGRARYSELAERADNPEALWKNGRDSGRGRNNCVSPPVGASGSLLLVQARNVEVAWEQNAYDGKNRPHAKFRFKGEDYILRVTDRRIPCPWGQGDRSFPECFICVSLAGEFRGLHSKLAAAIIEPERLP